MRALKYLVIVLVVIVPLVFAAGASTPERYTASNSIYLKGVMVPSLWATLTNFEAYPTWNPAVSKVEIIPVKSGTSLRSYDKSGNPTLVEIRDRNDYQSFRRVVAETTPEKRVEFAQVWFFELYAEKDGTRLTLSETSYEFNPLKRLYLHYFLGRDTAAKNFLTATAKKFGQDITPQPVTHK